MIWKDRLRFLLLFCLAVLCWFLSGNAYTELRDQPPATTFRDVGGLLVEDYEPMLRAEAQAKKPLPLLFGSRPATSGWRAWEPALPKTLPGLPQRATRGCSCR